MSTAVKIDCGYAQGSFSSKSHSSALLVGGSPDRTATESEGHGLEGAMPSGAVSMSMPKKPNVMGGTSAAATAAARLEKKLELLSQEDARVLLVSID